MTRLFLAAAALALLAGCNATGGGSYYGGGPVYRSSPYYGQPYYARAPFPGHGFYDRDRDRRDISNRKARRIADRAIDDALDGRPYKVKKIEEADRRGRYVVIKGEGDLDGHRRKDFRVVVDRKRDKVVDVFVEDTVGRRKR